MKVHQYREMMRELTKRKPAFTKDEADKIVKDYHKESEKKFTEKKQEVELKSKPMPITKYIDKINRLYGSDEGAVEAPHATDRIQEQDRIKEVKKFIKKKKVIPITDELVEESLVAKKPVKPKPPIISLLELEDWLNEIDPNWVEEKPEEEVLLRVPRSKAQGIKSILNLHNKRNT